MFSLLSEIASFIAYLLGLYFSALTFFQFHFVQKVIKDHPNGYPARFYRLLISPWVSGGLPGEDVIEEIPIVDTSSNQLSPSVTYKRVYEAEIKPSYISIPLSEEIGMVAFFTFFIILISLFSAYPAITSYIFNSPVEISQKNIDALATVKFLSLIFIVTAILGKLALDRCLARTFLRIEKNEVMRLDRPFPKRSSAMKPFVVAKEKGIFFQRTAVRFQDDREGFYVEVFKVWDFLIPMIFRDTPDNIAESLNSFYSKVQLQSG